MKILKLALSDHTYNQALKLSGREGVEVSGYCASLLSDYFGGLGPSEGVLPIRNVPVKHQRSGDFKIREKFIGFPEQSIRFAEIFIAEVQKVDPSVKLSKHKDSTIDIRDNFVRVEAILQRKHGIRVSFYGTPEMFVDAPRILGPGMGSYSRAVIENEKDLEAILPLIAQARELKSQR